MRHEPAIFSCKCQEIVFDLLLADRCLEACGSTERARVRPTERSLVRVFIDMWPIWVIFGRVRFEPSFRVLRSLTGLFLESGVVVWAVVRAPRRRLIIVAQGGKSFVGGEPLLTVWAPG